MSKPWWIDPSWDPAQDLEDCKEILELIKPAVRQHADVISELIQQNSALIKLVQEDRLEIALLGKEVMRLRARVEIAESQPLLGMVSTDSVK